MSNCLTFYDRQKLEWLLRTKQSLRAIAKIMRRDHSVLVRELNRNGDGNRKKYQANTAQRLFEKRTHKQHKGKLDKYPELKEYVVEGLKKEWSPDVIAGKLKQGKREHTISHESIYNYIYNKNGRYKKLHQYLRQAKPKRQKMKSRKPSKLRIPERISIHERPYYINERKRFGN